MIFMKGNGLNDSVFGKSQDPIKKFLMDSDVAAKQDYKFVEEIFNMKVDNVTQYMSKLN